MTTQELDVLAAETSAYFATRDPQYGLLGARIAVSNLHKQTGSDVLDVFSDMHRHGLVNDTVLSVVQQHHARLNDSMRYDLDYDFDYFGCSLSDSERLLIVQLQDA